MGADQGWRAQKDRFAALPDGTQATILADGDVDFPIGTVFMKTFKVGGGLVRPFNRAMIQLQLAYFYFCAADLNTAAQAMKAAFEIEPDVLFEYRFLAGWLIRRQREVPMFTRSEARDYIGWFTAHAAGHARYFPVNRKLQPGPTAPPLLSAAAA